ncbi:sugar transferase [Olleya namhaensis]|uniref:sugar transferase n=1 Tax=Olleya namhaensis TaxID=1144750 RepID=UPI0031ECE0D5
MTKSQRIIKRIFDIVISFIGLMLTGWLILIAIIVARLDTKMSGIFKQKRVGQNGDIFEVYKIRSMKNIEGYTTSVSTDLDPRITKAGRFWRKSKIDELPQLFNVFIGNMSFVGPRPDVPGFADKLTGEDKIILSIKPGITGPASIHFKNEEDLLATQKKPEEYNQNVIWPKKVEINKNYISNYSILADVKYIIKTFI